MVMVFSLRITDLVIPLNSLVIASNSQVLGMDAEEEEEEVGETVEYEEDARTGEWNEINLLFTALCFA